MMIYVAMTDVLTWGKSTNESEAIARALRFTSKTPTKIHITEIEFDGKELGPADGVLAEVGVNPMGNIFYPTYVGCSTIVRDHALITDDDAKRITAAWNDYNEEVRDVLPLEA